MFKDKRLTLFSIFAGFMGYLVSIKVYPAFIQHYSSVISIALEMLVFFVVTATLIIIYCKFNQYVVPFKDFVKLLICFGVVTGVSAGLEYIYEMNFFNANIIYHESTSIIGVIDKSGSMDASDPDGDCFTAMETVLENKPDDFPYAIYAFSDQLEELRPLAPKSEGVNINYTNGGGTFVKGALTSLYDKIKNNSIGYLGAYPKIVFLSDGAANDVLLGSSLNRLLKKYSKNHLTISTVGVGNSDDSLLKNIAEYTGGVFVKVNDIKDIEAKMQEAAENNSANPYARTLFSFRNVPSLDGLYAIMRVVFLFIIGMMISTANHLFATGRPGHYKLKPNVIKCLLAALLVELGVNTFLLSTNLLYLVYCILVALIFVYMIQRVKYVRKGKKTGKSEPAPSNVPDSTNRSAKKQARTSKVSHGNDAWGFMQTGSNIFK